MEPTQNIQQPTPVYYPESETEFNSQITRITVHNFKNKKLNMLLNDDMVRSYLNDYEIKALYHFVSCYQGLIDASTGRYAGVFDNAAEMVLSDIQFIINIARSRKGINMRVVKGRDVLSELNPLDPKNKQQPIRSFPSQEQQYDAYQQQQYGGYR